MKNNYGIWVETLLELERKPVGVKFLLSESDFESSELVVPSRGTPYCTAIRNAGNGRKCKMDAAHCSCIAASRALGMADITEEVSSGSRHVKLGVYENLCISRSVAKDMVYCNHKCVGVEIMPLEDFTDRDPDMVIIVTNPFNSMRIVQGYAYHFGQLKNIKMSGMCAICQDCTSYPFEKNTINLSMLCSGTRCVSQWGKDEMGIGIPYHYLDKIVSGILNTVNPMENNKDKKIISNKLDTNGLKDKLEIVYNQNYYKGAYGTPEQMKKKGNKLK